MVNGILDAWEQTIIVIGDSTVRHEESLTNPLAFFHTKAWLHP